MSGAEYRFGYWENVQEFVGAEVEIRPLPEHDQVMASAERYAQRGKKWFFPHIVSDSLDGVSAPAARFELPVTHVVTTPGRSHDSDLGEFLVLVLGFLHGLRFTLEGTGHLVRTPWKDGTLVDFTPWRREVIPCMTKALAFWDGATAEQRKLMFAAVHWYLVAQSYSHQFEELSWQYTVMDNLHKLTAGISTTYAGRFPPGKPRHADRPIALAAEYGSPLPDSFKDPNNGARTVGFLVDLRNDLIHEARWLGEPLGYAVGQDAHTTIQELTYFNSQIILGALGIDCHFRKLGYTRQIAALDIIPKPSAGTPS